MQVLGAVLRGDRLALPARDALPGEPAAACPGFDRYAVLMQRCWAQQPGERPTFAAVASELKELLELQK
jgi:hypothetical protein